MHKNFIFDWSGTLSDNFHLFCQVVNLVLADCNVAPISQEEVRKTFTIPYMKFWNTHVPDLTKERQDKLYQKYIHQVGEASLYPGVYNAVIELHANGHTLFVVSSDPVSKLAVEIQKSGLKNLFTKVEGFVHIKSEALFSIISEFSLNPDITYYVGDSSGDILSGKEAGIKTIGISWGFQDRDILKNAEPDCLIDTIEEIRNLI